MNEENNDFGFWAIAGVFVSLWGALEIGYAISLAANFWQASGKVLWGGFLLSVGSYLILLVLQKVRMKEA